MTNCKDCYQERRLQKKDIGYYCPFSNLKPDENKNSVCPVRGDWKTTQMWNSLEK